MAIEEMTYRDAISAALAEEMRRDPAVLIMGEDIGAPGGPLKTTQGLFDEFGGERVRDTPIAETGFIGAALGLALTGFRPVAEIMFADFLGVCFDQIVNSVAKHRFMSGGSLAAPLVIRVIGGGGLRFGPQHSATGENWFLGFPGLTIVTSSNPGEAYGLVKAAIRDDNPIMIVEHKALLGTKGPVERGADSLAPLTGPSVLREGTDVTVVATLAMVQRALDAADILAEQGISAEIIDLRVLRPLDATLIAESVKKTTRLVTVEETPRVGGWGAEVAVQVQEMAFEYLDAPPKRLTLPDHHPLPYSPPLEDAAIPDAADIAAAVQGLL